MNPNTNHLVDLNQFAKENPFGIDEQVDKDQKELMKKLEQQDYQMLAENLQHAAKVKLNGKSEATVSKTSGGKLSKWAVGQRKMQRNQNR